MSARRLLVMTGPGSSAGFALAGVPVIEASNASEAAARMERLIDDADAGVVVVDESIYREFPEELRRTLRSSSQPVVIPIPGPDWTSESSAHEYIVEILRRAIGYRVRLQ